MAAAGVKKTEAGLAFTGVLDHQTVPALIQQMPALDCATEVVLDISASDKIDSAGLAMLIDWGNRHLQAGQKIRLKGASLKVRQLIEIMSLDTFFELIA